MNNRSKKRPAAKKVATSIDSRKGGNDRPIIREDGKVAEILAVGTDVIERKRAEDALSESQRRLSVIVDSIADGFYTIDREWRFTHVNDAALRHMGKTSEEILGRTLFDVYPEARGSIIANEYESAMESGEPVRFESPSLITGRVLEIHAYPGPENLTVLFRDITEKHRMEKALRDAHEKAEWLARFPEENPNPVMRVSADGSSLYCNQASMEIPGLVCEVGKQLPELLLPLLGQAMSAGQEIQQDVELDKHVYSVAVVPIHGEGYANLYGHDITERKQAEEELKTTLQRLNAVVAGMQSSLLLVGEGRIEMANQAFCDYFGLQDTPGDLVGLTPRQLIDKIKNAYLRPDEQVRRIWEIARGRQTVIGEEISMRDGRTSLRDFIPIYVDGKSYGLLWQHIDITERREKEDRIAKLTRLYAALSRVNEAIVRVRHEASLYDEVCQILSEEGNFPLVWIGQVEQKQIVPAAWYGVASGYLREIKVETEGHFGQGPTGTSVRENRAVINDDFATSPAMSPWRETAIRFGFRSSAAFPLVRGGKAIASLTLYSSVPGAFDAEQVRLLESLSADISYALDALSQDWLRRAAEEAVRRSEERFRLLSSTAGRLLRADEPQTIVEELCGDVMAYLDCQAFFNFLVDEKAGRLRLNACAGIPDEEARAIEWLDYGVAVCGCVAQGRQRIIAEDILHTADVRTDLVKSFGIQAYCCHPLIAQDRLIGTLSFGTKIRAQFTPEEVELMRIVTDQVAVAIQRKQAEEALTQLNAELEQRVSERTAELRTASLYSRSLIEASLDPLVTISPDGKITDVNEATEQVTGRSRSELIGTDFSDYFTEPDAAQAGYRKVLADGQVRDYPLTIRDASGKTTDVLYNATVYHNAQGEAQGVFAAARDVTETKRVVAELAKHREHLEDMVKERTAELEAANKELESFSYSVSHDLRAPLRAIDGYARMILKKEGDKFGEETMRKFNVIRSSSQMMGQLIDDILTLSRVVKKHLSTSQLEMDSVIREVWKELETINPERNMKLTVQDVPAVYGDRTLIKQVYVNLLSNAVKFTKDRDPALIETGGYVEENENVYYIKDNGVGFEMEYYDKLFGIFQRLHKAEEFEGTGVGLAIVQRIVQRHGGRAWAEGKVNEGATFYFTLPQKR